MRRRIVSYMDALLVGMVLGVIFVSLVHAAPLHQRGKVQTNGVTIAYESYGAEQSRSHHPDWGNGDAAHRLGSKFCRDLADHGYRVVVFDNRDIGLSTKFESTGEPDFGAVVKAATSGKPSPLPYTLYDMAADAVGLMDRSYQEGARCRRIHGRYHRADCRDEISGAHALAYVDDGAGRKARIARGSESCAPCLRA